MLGRSQDGMGVDATLRPVDTALNNVNIHNSLFMRVFFGLPEWHVDAPPEV